MNTAHRIRIAMFAIVASAAAAQAARAEPEATQVAAAAVAPAPCGAGRLGPLQQRLVAKADQGIAPLVQFIHRTRMIYQLDVMEVANKLEGWRAIGNCATATAAGADVGG